MKLRLRFIAVVFFLTASWAAAEMVRFAVVGDTQGLAFTTAINEPIFSHIVQELSVANPPVEFVTIVGDLTNGNQDDSIHAEDYRQWRQIADRWYESNFIGLKVYPLPGNHDDHGSDNYLQIWQAAFPELPDNGPDGDKKMTYSFDIGPCHFAMVNTSAPAKDHQVNLEWLENDLKKSDKPTKFVLGHEPAYKVNATRISSLDVYPELRDRFWQILADNKVKAYFCGHDHVYDHWIKDNVHQIITGGGGGSSFEFHQYLVVEADETDATVFMYREPDNQLMEQYKLSDTKDVPNNDRTIYDDPSWPSALLTPCSWGSIPLILLLLIPFDNRSGGARKYFPGFKTYDLNRPVLVFRAVKIIGLAVCLVRANAGKLIRRSFTVSARTAMARTGRSICGFTGKPFENPVRRQKTDGISKNVLNPGKYFRAPPERVPPSEGL